MKIVTLLILLLIVLPGISQSLPIDFETSVVTADFVDFDGGAATVLANPQPNGINTSATVAQIVRDGGQVWAGSKIELAANLDFTTLNAITMKVFTTAPVGTIVKLKLEGAGSTERDVPTSVSGEWETLTWDFTAEPANFNFLVFMFDYGNTGDGSATSTFLFDDIEQLFGGTQIDLPVDFEGTTVNYTMSDFGGNESSLVSDPDDAGNTVMQAIKTEQAATWAGTTIGTPAGFATDIPLTLTDSKMTVRVWSPEAGTPIRLKVEDANDPTHTCETETNTTVAGWETLEFDFLNQAPGTELLSVGLSMGWTYNMASIFFNFGTDGATAGEKTYYFDDVQFGDLVLSIDDRFGVKGLSVFPNPATDQWTILIENENITSIEVFDLQGRLIQAVRPNTSTATLPASHFADGAYLAKVSTSSGTGLIRLLKK